MRRLLRPCPRTDWRRTQHSVKPGLDVGLSISYAHQQPRWTDVSPKRGAVHSTQDKLTQRLYSLSPLSDVVRPPVREQAGMLAPLHSWSHPGWWRSAAHPPCTGPEGRSFLPSCFQDLLRRTLTEFTGSPNSTSGIWPLLHPVQARRFVIQASLMA